MTQIDLDLRERRGWKASATGLVVVALLAIVVACGGGSDKKSSVTAAQMCAATAEPAVTIDAPDIVEASGIAASRSDKDIVWVHNDSGDTARVFAVDRRTGKEVGAFLLQGVHAVDWEDMAIGPGKVRKTGIYLADIGDNDAKRSEVTVYLVPVPDLDSAPRPLIPPQPLSAESFRFHYPDHPHDAETFMVDPASGEEFIVTKELNGGPSIVFYLPPTPLGSTTATLEQVGQIDFKSLPMAATPGPDAPTLVRALPFLPTGGDISPDGSLIAIRTYGSVWVWSRAKGESIGEALAGTPCEAPSVIEQQGEAIAFDADGRGYVTTSEGASPLLHHFVAGR